MINYFKKTRFNLFLLFSITINPACTQIISDFSVDIDGWLTYGDDGAAPMSISYNPTGGNPGTVRQNFVETCQIITIANSNSI